MKSSFASLLLLITLAGMGGLSPGLVAAEDDLAVQRQRGAALALELKSQKPAEGLTNTGTLRIRDSAGKRRELPVSIVTEVDDARWRVRYSARDTNSKPVESLTVTFTATQPPAYQVEGPSGIVPTDPDKTAQAFAGSDFWRCDLGLEFLHWPDQRVIKQEMSNGRLCWTLDSYNPGTNGYAHVRSWIDAEFHALLRAEAYDRQRRKTKEFSTGSFREVTTRDGRSLWMLKDIRIRDEFRDTRTELIYDLNR
jgi:hypothetical protein